MSGDRMQGNGLELCQGKFRLDIRRKLFTVRAAKHWNKLPGELVTVKLEGVPETFGQCSSMYGLKFRLPLWSQELHSMILVGHFQLRIFYDSVYYMTYDDRKHE